MNEVRWTDGRGRFWSLFDRINRQHGPTSAFRPTAEVLHRPDGTDDRAAEARPGEPFRRPIRLLLVPGLGASLTGGLGEPLADAAGHVRRLGVIVETLPVPSLASSWRNAALIAQTLARRRRHADERIVLLGYSKGAMDALMAAADHPAVAERVDALISLAGSIGGSLLVDQLPDALVGGLHRVRRWLPTGGLWSLRRRQRRAWLQVSRAPERVRLYTIAAHAGRERISGLLRPSYERLRLIDPKNDGQVLLIDQIVPGSTLLAELNCDHWAAALPLVRRRPWLRHLGLGANDFPREALLEATLRIIDHDLA